MEEKPALFPGYISFYSRNQYDACTDALNPVIQASSRKDLAPLFLQKDHAFFVWIKINDKY